jgi:nucleotide-binding universal stress UspA family protein
MSYKTIVVHLDCGARRTERLDLALEIAEEFDSHLVGLFALDVIPTPPVPEALPVILETERKRRDACIAQGEQEFQVRTARRVGKVEWRWSEGDAVGSVCFAARHADLVIIGQTDPDTYSADAVPPGFAADVVLSAGKPVLVVPFAGHFSAIGKRAFVAWNEAREAARAVTDALPVLKRAKAVDVVTFERPRKGPDLTDPLAAARGETLRYLGRHGVNAKFSTHVSEDLDVGELILSRAADEAADSIVMGAYGHSRLRETILGGATRSVLKSMTVPVLMSH